MATALIDSARTQFEKDGLFIAGPVIPLELIERVIPAMDAVMDAKYETGVPPRSRTWNPGGNPMALRKIDDSHLANRTIYELITHPALGRMAAEVTGAKMVQVWATQLLYKPPAAVSSPIETAGNEIVQQLDKGNVGWHQDRQYWKYWDGEVFTAWVAVSDVRVESGPMKLVRGSHTWGELEGGDFFGSDLDAQKAKLAGEGKNWDEVLAILPPGGVSFHHRLTVHGSGANVSRFARRSFAIHMRTEKSTPAKGANDYYVQRLDDPTIRPVIYGN